MANRNSRKPSKKRPQDRPMERCRSLFRAISALLSAITSLLLLLSDSPSIHYYSTAIGEQLPLYLLGAQLTLNTNTRLTVRQTQTTLDIRVLQGEVLFRIEHRPQRHVEVLTANARISDIGTTFDVHVTEDKVTVTVVDGSLDLSPIDETIARTTLRRAEHGELIFDANSVAEIVQQFNRHNRHPKIEIQTPGIASVKMSGVFSPHDPRAFVSALQHIDPNVHLQPADAPGSDLILSLSR